MQIHTFPWPRSAERLLAVTLCCVLLLTAVACGKGNPGAEEVVVQGDATVTIDNFAFKPARLQVPRGATVTWINHDGALHDAAPKRDGRWIPLLKKREAGSYTFTETGTFAYICSIHPYMQGTITVVA